MFVKIFNSFYVTIYQIKARKIMIIKIVYLKEINI